jgi:hypothetical protein
VSSDLPQKEGNSTGFTLDASTDENLDAVMKLQEKPVVITAEAGGLKVAEPLDSRVLMRRRYVSASPGSDLPIADAEPGFVAEPLSLTVRSVYLFPEGRKQMGDAVDYSGNRPGVTVNAKLFAPKGRILLSAEDVKVSAAKDDKGRVIGKGSGEDDDVSFRSYSSGSEPGNSAGIQLQLPLPEFDAQAIDELNGEATTVTAGGWKQIAITNVQSGSTNEVDLGELLPGAKMVVKKVTSRSRQIQVQVQVTGPEAINRLDLKLTVPGNEEIHSYSSNRGSSGRSGTTTRTVDVQAYTYGMENEAAPGPVSLVVRYPQELKRERVRFTLRGLDLL